MASTDFINVKEVFIKTDRIQGNMVVLKESEGDPSYFLMFVGDAEITAIAKEKGLVEPKRPLTHDLYLSVLNRAGIKFDRIEIFEMQENTYYAKVYARIGDEEVEFDSRPSDAVALALHEKCPIMVSRKLLRRELSTEEVQEYEAIVRTVKF
ncbi:bifunctional nuclease family protein [Desulfoferrobacter suflitae]|uniref:bifunctional nuclease family protein n=1 Tax=Desulfoferrobacter suflitae TaxID=2865782 RepID=UPI002164A99B|nr:bifunctional nuclease family protein [Desulfoferrobacter suflitae]MCK8603135.1 bifunctional nuclease family protein [Desulfoferrobacter suflitae]